MTRPFNEKEYTPDVNHMTAAQEARFERDALKHFRSYRAIPPGRNFEWNKSPEYFYEKKRYKEEYKTNFDKIFPNAPGAGI